MKRSFCLVLMFCGHLCIGQVRPSFTAYTRNANLADANESSVQVLMDTTISRFLQVANDTQSRVHKSIYSEFELAGNADRLESYRFPAKLKKSHLAIQFLDCSNEHGLLGADSAWNSDELSALIFIPVMYDDLHGNSIINLCFKTDLSISSKDKMTSSHVKQQISFKIREVPSLTYDKSHLLYELK